MVLTGHTVLIKYLVQHSIVAVISTSYWDRSSNDKRYYYEKCLDSYIKKINSGSLPEKIEEEKDKNASAQISNIDEYLMLRLRLSRGIDENDVKEKFGIDLLTKYPRILDFLKSGYMKKEGSAYSFTAKGFFVSNFILTEILSFE